MIKFGVLGPLTVQRDGESRQIPMVMARRMLCLLLARRNEPVPMDVIIDELWSGHAPRTARQALQVHISRIRQVLGDDHVVTHRNAYAIHPRGDELDSVHFEHLVTESAGAGSSNRTLRTALGLWRGPAYDGMLDMPSVAVEALRLEHLRLAAVEGAIQLDLDAGSHTAVIAELGTMIAQHPYRERMRQQYMLALYRSGRRADALEAYRQTYQVLTDDLGIEPMPDLQELHQRMLTGDPTLIPETTITVQDTRPPLNLLPRSVANFTGRDEQLTALDAIAVTDGISSPVAILSAITGSAGVGKTALAVHWARRATERFPDGQLYINLQGYGGGEPLRPLDALTYLLRELGVPTAELPGDEPAAMTRYHAMLAKSRTLVILDNANSVTQVRPLLASGPECMSVITSRDRLAGLVARDGAHRVPLDMLSTADSVALLATIIGAKRIDTEPQAAAALAEACGNLPLALRITAAVLADEPTRSIADHVTQLSGGGRLPLLAIDGDPDSSVRVALSHSYLRRAPEVQRMFRLLGILPVTEIGLASAAALAGCRVDEAAALLVELCEAHLLTEPAPGRYQLHDLIRDYARELATTEDTSTVSTAAVDRAFAWYVAQADRATSRITPRVIVPSWVDLSILVEDFDDQLSALAWFDLEGPNIIGALRAIETTQPATSLQLAASLFVWFQRQRTAREWADVYLIGLNAAARTANAEGEARMRTGLAIAAAYSGQPADALPHFTRVLQIQRDIGTPRQIIGALQNVAGVLSELSRSDEAVVHLTEALQIVDTNADLEDARLGVLGFIGFAYSRSRHQEAAIPFYREAIKLGKDHANHFEIANSSNNLAALLMRLERFDEAKEVLQAALPHAELTGHRVALGRVLTNRGHVAVHEGRIDDAKAYLQRALEADADVDDADLREQITAAQNMS